MPQIGWFELLIVVLVAILFIGPKDFPVVLRKIGNWIGSTKKYFNEIQQKVNQEITEEDISPEEKYSSKSKDKFFETTFSIVELEHPVKNGKTRENITRVT